MALQQERQWLDERRWLDERWRRRRTGGDATTSQTRKAQREAKPADRRLRNNQPH